MKRKSNTSIILIIVIVVLVGYLVYEHLPQSKTSAVSNASTATTTAEAESKTTPVKPKASDWKNYSDGTGFSLMYPSYTSIGVDSKATELDKNPTVLSYHHISFTPDPNADFKTFSAVLEVDNATNFILDMPDRFISLNAETSAWYSDTNLSDKPSSSHRGYENLYLSSDQFSPPIYGKTSSGLYIYGPFLLGDSNRGTASYLVPINSKNVVVDLKYTYNGDALSGSSATIKALKKQFDKDLPSILKSIASL